MPPDRDVSSAAAAWHKKASGDLAAARACAAAEEVPAWIVAFHLQQASEKALKGMMVLAGIEPPAGAQPRASRPHARGVGRQSTALPGSARRVGALCCRGSVPSVAAARGRSRPREGAARAGAVRGRSACHTFDRRCVTAAMNLMAPGYRMFGGRGTSPDVVQSSWAADAQGREHVARAGERIRAGSCQRTRSWSGSKSGSTHSLRWQSMCTSSWRLAFGTTRQGRTASFGSCKSRSWCGTCHQCRIARSPCTRRSPRCTPAGSRPRPVACSCARTRRNTPTFPMADLHPTRRRPPHPAKAFLAATRSNRRQVVLTACS
jgi:hypothetical protein